MFDLIDSLIDSLFDLHICSFKFGKWIIARLLDAVCTIFLALTVLGFVKKIYIIAIVCLVGTVIFSILDWRFFKKRFQEKYGEESQKVE